MEHHQVMKINLFINEVHQCLSFSELLKLTIMKLHELVIYDSGMFFCAISRDCSFFKPYIGGDINQYYQKRVFAEREMYQNTEWGKEAYVYKALDYSQGIVQVDHEPRRSFLEQQDSFHIVCIRIVHKGEFLGEIYLHRSKEKPDFSEDDLFTLRLIQPHISTAFSIIHTVTAVKYSETEAQNYKQKGICMFDRELSLIGGNMMALEMLKMSTKFGSSILYHIKELCLDMIEKSSTNVNDGVQMQSATLKLSGDDMMLDIFSKNIRSDRSSGRFVVTMEFMSEGQAIADYKYKFSKREAEVIDGLIQGKNNTQLAEALSLSENTVKTHIKNIYKKTGTNNRTELTYVLMLNNP